MFVLITVIFYFKLHNLNKCALLKCWKQGASMYNMILGSLVDECDTVCICVTHVSPGLSSNWRVLLLSCKCFHILWCMSFVSHVFLHFMILSKKENFHSFTCVLRIYFLFFLASGIEHRSGPCAYQANTLHLQPFLFLWQDLLLVLSRLALNLQSFFLPLLTK